MDLTRVNSPTSPSSPSSSSASSSSPSSSSPSSSSASSLSPSSPSSSPSSSSSAEQNSISPRDLQEAYLLGKENKDEISVDLLKSRKNWSIQKIMIIFNRLAESRVCALKKSKIQPSSSSPFSSSSAQIYCKLRNEETIQKLKQIDSNDYRVFCVVEESGNTGLWTADIRKQTGLQIHQVQKSVKNLCENKNLIKPVKNIHIKNRKVYMLSNLEPSKEVAGGSFYKNGEFDESLILYLRHQISHFLMNGKNSTLENIANYVRTSGDMRSEITDDDILSVILGFELEEKVYHFIQPATREVVFCWSKWTRLTDMAEIPCGRCPLFEMCYNGKGQKVSPEKCEYLSKWLDYDFDVLIKN